MTFVRHVKLRVGVYEVGVFATWPADQPRMVFRRNRGFGFWVWFLALGGVGVRLARHAAVTT